MLGVLESIGKYWEVLALYNSSAVINLSEINKNVASCGSLYYIMKNNRYINHK